MKSFYIVTRVQFLLYIRSPYVSEVPPYVTNWSFLGYHDLFATFMGFVYTVHVWCSIPCISNLSHLSKTCWLMSRNKSVWRKNWNNALTLQLLRLTSVFKLTSMSVCLYVCTSVYVWVCTVYSVCTFVLYTHVVNLCSLHRHTVTHYAFVFINEKARNSWVEQFTESKKIAEGARTHTLHMLWCNYIISCRIQYGAW